MPRRTIIAIAAGSVAALIAIGVAVFVIARDDTLAADGDLIAYSCKEPKNVWYAICVIHQDGTESRRLTSRIPATDQPGRRTAARSRSREEKTWASSPRTPRTTSSS